MFCAGIAILVSAIFRYVNWQWISLGLGMGGMVLALSGFVVKDKVSRLGGLSLFAFTLARVIFVDMA